MRLFLITVNKKDGEEQPDKEFSSIEEMEIWLKVQKIDWTSLVITALPEE